MNTDTTEVRDTRFFYLEVDDPRWRDAALNDDDLYLWLLDEMGAAGRELPVHFKSYMVDGAQHEGVRRYEFKVNSVLPREVEVLAAHMLEKVRAEARTNPDWPQAVRIVMA